MYLRMPQGECSGVGIEPLERCALPQTVFVTQADGEYFGTA
jgi:hypothetical protein